MWFTPYYLRLVRITVHSCLPFHSSPNPYAPQAGVREGRMTTRTLHVPSPYVPGGARPVRRMKGGAKRGTVETRRTRHEDDERVTRIINLRCYTVVTGEPDVVTGPVPPFVTSLAPFPSLTVTLTPFSYRSCREAEPRDEGPRREERHREEIGDA